MRYTTLPGTDIRVSVIAMGSWALAGDMAWGEQSELDSLDAARAALDAGINFFDTAPGYGDGLSEERLGKGLLGVRDRAVIATKIGPEAMRPESAVASVERSLVHLRTDYIDLLQIHWPHRELPIADTWGALEKLREQGKARALGISNFGLRDFEELARVGTPTTNQLPYALLARAIEHEIVPACQEHGVGVLCYSPLLWGLLAGTFERADDVPPGRARSRHFAPHRELIRHTEQGCERETFEALAKLRSIAARLEVSMSELAIAWLLHQPAVTSVLTGIRRPAQASANARAASVTLDAETLAELDVITTPVKNALGKNPDLWQSGENSRYR